MKKAVLSISGGMDSTCLLIHLLAEGYEVSCFSFDYGQKHKIELDRLDCNLAYLLDKGFDVTHTRIDLSGAMSSLKSALTLSIESVPMGHYAEQSMKKTVVPNRNAIFSSIIYAQAQSLADTFDENIIIALGVHSGDHAIYPDCRLEFYESIEQAFKLGNWNSDKVDFYLPFIKGDKASILEEALCDCKALGLDFDTVLRNTNTSYLPDETGRANGRTGSDVERILAFHSIGRVDPVEYTEPWANVLSYAIEQEVNYAE